VTIHLDLWDSIGIAGGILLFAGLAWAWLPLVPIGIGAALLTVGIFGARKTWGSSRHSSAAKQTKIDDLNDDPEV
jgi:hypothetical protein